MHASYSDITSRIKESPKWHDSDGVPRYADFHPEHSPNIYADQVVLLRIRCQDCGRPMKVELNSCSMDLVRGHSKLRERVTGRTIHYGDPPIHNEQDGTFCHAGCTMNSIPERVLEFWQKDGFDWRRVPELEIEIPCEWAEGGDDA